MTPTSHPRITGVYETVLYGDDVAALAAFYVDLLGLRVVDGPDELAAAIRLPDGGMLLVFHPTLAATPPRRVPLHGAHGPGHVAFGVPRGQLDAWRTAIVGRGQPIEQEVTWAEGGRSIYVRDPAGNSVELTEDELWPV